MPSAKQYEARWRNAQNVAQRLIHWIDQGYMLFDSEGYRVLHVEVTDRAIYLKDSPDSRCRTLVFENDPKYDHGMEMTVTEFNAKFDKWVVAQPARGHVLDGIPEEGDYSTPPRIELDRHLDGALDFAENNVPCLLVVDTLYAMEAAQRHLQTLKYKVGVLRGATPSTERYATVLEFERGETDVLIATKALAGVGNRLFVHRRAASVAATGVYGERQAEQIKARVLNPVATFVKEVK